MTTAMTTMIRLVLLLILAIPICATARTLSTIHIPRGGGASSSSSSSSWRAAPQQKQRQTTSYPSSYYQQQVPDGMTVLDLDDVEDLGEIDSIASTKMIDSFLTRDSRNKFIARVYMILTVQLALTAGTCTWFGFKPSLVRAMHLNNAKIVPAISLMLSSFAWIFMSYSPKARRDPQMKWGLLALFTIGEAVLVGFLSSLFKFSSVVSAMMSTALATLAISGYTLLNPNSKYDLSQWGMGLSSCGLIFLVYGLLAMFLPKGWIPYNELILSGIGAALFSVYLAHHTKLVVGGKHTKFQFHEEDYVFAAMTLYEDIINIFLYILQILGDDADK